VCYLRRQREWVSERGNRRARFAGTDKATLRCAAGCAVVIDEQRKSIARRRHHQNGVRCLVDDRPASLQARPLEQGFQVTICAAVTRSAGASVGEVVIICPSHQLASSMRSMYRQPVLAV